MEKTKWLKPSISVSRIGDSASVQAATRVNAADDAAQIGLEPAQWQATDKFGSSRAQTEFRKRKISALGTATFR
jgi:hypothetical protein